MHLAALTPLAQKRKVAQSFASGACPHGSVNILATLSMLWPVVFLLDQELAALELGSVAAATISQDVGQDCSMFVRMYIGAG